jgi:hypothetical protein
MKKKNIIKKLLSVILSAATMFSLLTLPAYAIIPGENSLAFVTADERETGYYQVDLDTQVTTYIPRSNIPVFSGNSTYDALPADARLQMQTNSVNLATSLMVQQKEELLPLAIGDGIYSFVSPTQYLYSGVVLIALFNGDEFAGVFSTGYMLDSGTFLTNIHSIYAMDDNTSEVTITSPVPDVRVYFDVNIDRVIGSYDEINDELSPGTWAAIEVYLENHHDNYIEAATITYSDAIFKTNTNGHTDREYDWIVGKLKTPNTDDIFYWDCMIPNTTLEGTYTYAVGYPGEYALRMVETVGQIYDIYEYYNAVESTNSIVGGMSGSPTYVVNNGIKCIGILRGTVSYDSGYTVYSESVKFYPGLLNLIVYYMNS